MPELRRYNLFISHAWKYGEEYKRLKDLLDESPNFSYHNYSAPKEKPLELSNNPTEKEIKTALDNKIRPSSIILVISGMYYNYREWMQYELEKAHELKKPIIAVMPWGNVNIPSEVLNYSINTVAWNSASIVKAVREYSL